MLLLVPVLLGGAARAEDTGFWRQLTPEERRAAGVDQLTPEQQAALDQLAGRFAREGARKATEQTKEAMREQAREEVRAEVKQEVRAEVKQEVREEVRSEVKQELKAAAKAKAVAQAGRPAAEEESRVEVRSRIVGDFNGWSGRTVFRLENGQVWVQSDSSDRYWMPTVKNQEVVIRPSKLGGWKLYLGENGAWVRVRRL